MEQHYEFITNNQLIKLRLKLKEETEKAGLE